MALYPGQTVWFEAGRQFSTGFNVLGRVSYAVTKMTMGSNWGPFEGQDRQQIYFSADLIFSKPFNIKCGHFIEPGAGLKFLRQYVYSPQFGLDIINNEIYVFINFGPIVFNDLCLTLVADYYYQFGNGFYLGLRTDIYALPGIGFEGLTLSPMLGVKF